MPNTKRLNIRVDEKTHGLLTIMADAEGASVQKLVEQWVVESVSARMADPEMRAKVRERLDQQARAFGIT